MIMKKETTEPGKRPASNIKGASYKAPYAKRTSPGRGAFLPLGRILPQVVEQKMPKSSGIVGRLLLHWPQAVGDALAAQCRPARLLRGNQGAQTLEVRPYGSAGIFVSHQTVQIVEWVNHFLGYTAIVAVRVGKPLELPNVESAVSEWSEPGVDAISLSDKARALIAEISDPEMREKLERWLITD